MNEQEHRERRAALISDMYFKMRVVMPVSDLVNSMSKPIAGIQRLAETGRTSDDDHYSLLQCIKEIDEASQGIVPTLWSDISIGEKFGKFQSHDLKDIVNKARIEMPGVKYRISGDAQIVTIRQALDVVLAEVFMNYCEHIRDSSDKGHIDVAMVQDRRGRTWSWNYGIIISTNVAPTSEQVDAIKHNLNHDLMYGKGRSTKTTTGYVPRGHGLQLAMHVGRMIGLTIRYDPNSNTTMLVLPYVPPIEKPKS